MINLRLNFLLLNFLSLLIICITNVNYCQGQCIGNLLINGSLTSIEGENVLASGWTGNLSPDVNDAIGPVNTTSGYVWNGTPLASSDGGTWQNICSGETIEQTVNLILGQTYTLEFEYANQGIHSGSFYYSNPVGVKVFIDGILYSTTPNDITPYTWETECISFTAPDSLVTIKFQASTSLSYLGIDGICLLSGSYSTPFLGNDTTLCFGDSLVLSVTSSSAICLWQNNSTNSTFTVTQQGIYWVEITNSNCFNSDTINVNYYPSLIVDLGNDTTICQGETLLLNPNTSGTLSFLWQNNSTNPTYNVTQAGIYWVEVSDSFGCSNSDTINVNYNPSPVVNLGNDSTLCDGDSLLLDATSMNVTSYLWQDASSNSNLLVKQQGIYWVEVTNSFGCIDSDTINVNYNQLPLVSLGNDTTICQGETLLLNPNTSSSLSFIWQNNSTSPTFNVTQAGIYWVEISDSIGCSNSDTINVNYNPSPVVNLGNDTTLCEGDSLLLDATSMNFTSYLWQDASSNSNLLVKQQGIYWVEVVNSFGCSNSDTINVNYIQLPLVHLGNDTTLCNGKTILLDATSTNASIYRWQNNSTNPTFSVTLPGTYWIEVMNNCGINSDTINVKFKDCNCFLYIPNSFTPNSDNLNDKFKPVSNCDFSEFKFMIFNRWGSQIFETNNPYNSWDGTTNGQKSPLGVYIYLLIYKFKDEDNNKEYGSVTLIR